MGVRMMDFLREMEMLKQVEILGDMHDLEGLRENQVKNTNPSRPASLRKKEAAK
jgi:hypothetical protein